MTSQHDTRKRWRPRFSVKTLAIVVTLVCCYAACWGPTKLQGVGDVGRRAGRELGFAVEAETAEADYWVSQLFDASPTMPLVVDLTNPGYRRRDYYFWFFGYVVKLPFEREISVSRHF
ncbi:MAG TPA: hypothetical protein VMM76_28735 [Pirellulaceae bacterium]|nr:hypothetical protein [Pirellulaceae bacterium]